MSQILREKPAATVDPEGRTAHYYIDGDAVVTLRRTQRLSRLLPETAAGASPPDTALGDWYVNRVVVDRQPLLLLVSSTSLLPMVLPARGVRDLPDQLPDLVATRLRRYHIPEDVIAAEMRAMQPVHIGPTVSRSVVGIMIQFAKELPFRLHPGEWDETTLLFIEGRMAKTPCHAGKRLDLVVFPEIKAPELVLNRWSEGMSAR